MKSGSFGLSLATSFHFFSTSSISSRSSVRITMSRPPEFACNCLSASLSSISIGPSIFLHSANNAPLAAAIPLLRKIRGNCRGDCCGDFGAASSFAAPAVIFATPSFTSANVAVRLPNCSCVFCDVALFVQFGRSPLKCPIGVICVPIPHEVPASFLSISCNMISSLGDFAGFAASARRVTFQRFLLAFVFCFYWVSAHAGCRVSGWWRLRLVRGVLIQSFSRNLCCFCAGVGFPLHPLQVCLNMKLRRPQLQSHSACLAKVWSAGRREFALESAAARILREAGGRVGTNSLMRDMDPCAGHRRPPFWKWLWRGFPCSGVVSWPSTPLWCERFIVMAPLMTVHPTGTAWFSVIQSWWSSGGSNAFAGQAPPLLSTTRGNVM